MINKRKGPLRKDKEISKINDSYRDHVHFLPPVASTSESAGNIDRGKGGELVHGEGPRGINKAIDGEAVTLPSDLYKYESIEIKLESSHG